MRNSHHRAYRNAATFAALVAAAISLTACDLSPDFKLPDLAMPSVFKQDVAEDVASVAPATDGRWKRFDDTARIQEFAWWRMFGDTTLDGLMERAMKDNPTLEAALERVKSARAVSDDRDADLYPAIAVGVGPERSRQSPASQEPNLPPGTSANVKPYTLYRAQGTISYELDVFGRNRNRALAAWFDAAGEQNNFLASRLSLQAELAQTYFRLASLKAEEKLLNRTLATREEALALLKKKQEVGAVDTLVVSSSETDLANVKAERANVSDARKRSEHALAVLVGVPPSELTLDAAVLVAEPPTVPAGMPSSLLERRPDILRAVEAMKAANARIGVARTGYFPEISLSAMGGFVSGDIGDLFKWSNRTWMIGPLAGTAITQPIFEGGRIAAARAQSDADYAEAVANYRAAVLQAFREVEDQLSGVGAASERMKATRDGLAASARAYSVAKARFAAGYSSHIELLDAERSNLAAERAQVQTRGDQYVATVQLIRALGGSWQTPGAPESIAPVEAPTTRAKN